MLKKIAAMGAAGLLSWGLNSAPASAEATSMEYVHIESVADVGECLDYRFDWGPYTTTCNEGAYQTWLMSPYAETETELRQNAGARLCLVARNGVPVMRDCIAGDQAALWTLHDGGGAGWQLVNKATKTCLVAGSDDHHRVGMNTCSTGGSRSWILYS
ncbi:ricin-type beta-trefoil lectin domain protein [Streptomyces sp. NPDC127069]|uniref:RICIN domain-containing protein n=1 Tax=Streptomyces sp. NPDC127069 TaxID=3347128 RepID=UPI00366548AC